MCLEALISSCTDLLGWFSHLFPFTFQWENRAVSGLQSSSVSGVLRSPRCVSGTFQLAGCRGTFTVSRGMSQQEDEATGEQCGIISFPVTADTGALVLLTLQKAVSVAGLLLLLLEGQREH